MELWKVAPDGESFSDKVWALVAWEGHDRRECLAICRECLAIWRECLDECRDILPFFAECPIFLKRFLPFNHKPNTTTLNLWLIPKHPSLTVLKRGASIVSRAKARGGGWWRAENSPAFQRWVCRPNINESRMGRKKRPAVPAGTLAGGVPLFPAMNGWAIFRAASGVQWSVVILLAWTRWTAWTEWTRTAAPFTSHHSLVTKNLHSSGRLASRLSTLAPPPALRHFPESRACRRGMSRLGCAPFSTSLCARKPHPNPLKNPPRPPRSTMNSAR